MAQEQGYRRQTGSVAPANLPQASGAAFGAGIGQSISELGGVLHDSNVRAYRLERQNTADSEAADFNARFAAAREEADKTSIDARNNAAAGGAGHADQTKAWWDERQAGLLDGITDDRIRRSAEQQLNEFGSRFRSTEYQWQEGARIGKVVTDTQAATELAANRAYRAHDTKSFGEELSLGRQSIEAYVGVPDDVKDKLIKHHDETVSVSYLNGIVDTNPKLVASLLDSGAFDGIVSPKQADSLRNGAQVEVRRTEAVARAEAAHQTAIAKDELGAVEGNLNSGAGSYQDRIGVAQRYEAIGDKSKAAEWRGKAAEFSAVQGSRDWTLPQMDTRLAALDAKRNAGGLSAPEAHEYNGLKDQRTATQGRLSQDGGALLQLQYATGKPVAPLDPSDPASLAARGRQARVAASTYGRYAVEPILQAELPAFKDMMANGANGRLQAVDAIRAFGDARTIAGAARQMAGADDGTFRIAALMPRDVARDVLRGGDALKAAPQVWNERTATNDFDKWYGRALSWVGGSYRTDIFQAAKAFYAQRASDGGEDAYNPGKFAQAIETVLGRTSNGKGGVARTERGIVLAPAGMDPKVMLQTFARAAPADYARAADGRTPRWSDGSTMTVQQFRQLLPTQVADGHYGFRGPNGQLVHDDQGNPYTVDLSRLGAK